jgi:mannose-6-phosphate isomerase-like protein (cupin superfamily)
MPLDKFDSHENMRVIRVLSEKPDVIPLKNIAAFVGAEVTYECKRGTCVGIALMKNDRVGVQYAELSADTEMEAHTHIENEEHLIAVTGELFSKIGEEVKSAKAGEVMTIHSGQTHIPYCVVPTTVIGITVPASEGYPNE